MHVNLDNLKQLALKGDSPEFRATCTPEVVVHLLESIETLMDDDSILAAQQRVSKSALESMMAARKERDEANAALAAEKEVSDSRLRIVDLAAPVISAVQAYLREGDQISLAALETAFKDLESLTVKNSG